jgi:hypothetical protein
LELRAHIRRSRAEQQDAVSRASARDAPVQETASQVNVVWGVATGGAVDTAAVCLRPEVAGVASTCAALESVETLSPPPCAPETPPRGLVAQAVCAFERRCQSHTPTGGTLGALRWGPCDGRVPTPQSVGSIGNRGRASLHMVAPRPSEALPATSC